MLTGSAGILLFFCPTYWNPKNCYAHVLQLSCQHLQDFLETWSAFKYLSQPFWLSLKTMDFCIRFYFFLISSTEDIINSIQLIHFKEKLKTSYIKFPRFASLMRIAVLVSAGQILNRFLKDYICMSVSVAKSYILLWKMNYDFISQSNVDFGKP